jgi:hypothetical protein
MARTTHLSGTTLAAAAQFYGLNQGRQADWNPGWWFFHSANFPLAGTLKNLRVRNAVLLADRTYTIVIDGVPTALTVTVPAGATNGADLINTVAIAAGDNVAIEITVAGGVTGGEWNVDFEAAGADYFSLILGSILGQDGVSVKYLHLSEAVDTPQAAEADTYCIAPCDGKIKRLFCYQDQAFGATAWWWQMTLRKNGVSTALTVRIDNWGVNHYGSDVVNEVAVAKGDRLDWKLETGGGSASHPRIGFGAVFIPSEQAGETAVWCAGESGNLDAAFTRYHCLLPAYSGAWSAGLEPLMVQGGTLRAANLYVRLSAAPGAAASGKQYTFTLMRNGVATALTCTVLNDATFAEDAVTNVALADGDELTLRCVPLNGPDVVTAAWGIMLWAADPLGSRLRHHYAYGRHER